MQNKTLIALLADLAQDTEMDDGFCFDLCDQIWPVRVTPVCGIPPFSVVYAGDWEIEIHLESTALCPGDMPLECFCRALASTHPAPKQIAKAWDRATRSALRQEAPHGFSYAIAWDTHTMARLLLAIVMQGGRVEPG